MCEVKWVVSLTEVRNKWVGNLTEVMIRWVVNLTEINEVMIK